MRLALVGIIILREREKSVINQTELRKAFSGEPKTIKRISISQVTWDKIGQLVETGNGKYGSSFLNVAARILLYILGDFGDVTNVINTLNAVLIPKDSTEINKARYRLEIIANVLFNISESLRQREKLTANVEQWTNRKD